MGVTGSSDKVAINTELPDIISRIRQFTDVPIGVGFGVASRSHFESVQNAGADGVIIGSRIVTTIKAAPAGQITERVKAFCSEITNQGQATTGKPRSASARATPVASPGSNLGNPLSARFGTFGGQFVPESLVDCLVELEQAHNAAMADPEFIKEFKSHYGYMNRPSGFYFAENLTNHIGGANIWFKREDLCVSSLSERPHLFTSSRQEPHRLT